MNMITTVKMPTLTGNDIATKRQEIKHYFNNSWAQYQSLFSLINHDDAFYLKAEPLRHPLIFYFGHTATFYVNKLLLGKYIDQRIDPHLEAICAVGVDEMSWDDLDSANYDWPSVDHVKHYRDKVHVLIENIIDTMDLTLPIKQNSLAWVILMAIEHERIHIETSSVIIRMLPLAYLTESPQWPSCLNYDKAPKNSFIGQAGRKVKLGKPDSDNTYGWDNEYGENIVEVSPFEASTYLVSNQEYLEFVNDNGYQNLSYWCDEGQQWLSYSKASMPRFWQHQHGEYFQRNLTKLIPLPLNWPVEVNYLEAKAFCNWKGQQSQEFIRLPTEAEWQLLREKVSDDLPTWQVVPGNINLAKYASSCPIDTFKHQDLYDVVGNVWQWTESPINAFPGFKVHPLYDDFSTPTFDSRHNLIKGGSWISTGNEALKHARYAFRRHFYQHAGFRYIRSESKNIPTDIVTPFEQDAKIANKLALHYQQGFEGIPSLFKQAIVAIDNAKAHFNTDRALDLGCSVGGATFELAQLFEHVDGIDLTARHIQHALAFKEQKILRYALPTEGELLDYHELSLTKMPYADYVQQVHFYQGDALNLKPQFSGYDLIFSAHLIDSIAEPHALINVLQQKLNPGGVLVLITNYQADQTLVTNALGGYKINGENFTRKDGLQTLLLKHFKPIASEEINWLKRVNARHFIYNKSELSIWKKQR
ncbi:5-histidylcysteine sulfoxide synthase [Thalassotalea sp. PLHSN55]|uniref:5-histidylcysteine sulfoxide synthase n=1 Tax=Thalassotalea sp. PLHSN55 TaxID=3435888 RepID=UPI003F8595C4